MDFNKAEALDRVEGDWDFYLELVACFLADYPNSISKLKSAAAARDSAEVGMVAHTIKGALGNLSAINAREIALKLERIGKSGNTTGAETLIIELEGAVEAYQKAVEREK
jgi:two-component system sensor histidine kinase/response regulator